MYLQVSEVEDEFKGRYLSTFSYEVHQNQSYLLSAGFNYFLLLGHREIQNFVLWSTCKQLQSHLLREKEKNSIRIFEDVVTP